MRPPTPRTNCFKPVLCEARCSATGLASLGLPIPTACTHRRRPILTSGSVVREATAQIAALPPNDPLRARRQPGHMPHGDGANHKRGRRDAPAAQPPPATPTTDGSTNQPKGLRKPLQVIPCALRSCARRIGATVAVLPLLRIAAAVLRDRHVRLMQGLERRRLLSQQGRQLMRRTFPRTWDAQIRPTSPSSMNIHVRMERRNRPRLRSLVAASTDRATTPKPRLGRGHIEAPPVREPTSHLDGRVDRLLPARFSSA